MSGSLGRRSFLRSTAAAGAAVGLSSLPQASAFAAEAKANGLNIVMEEHLKGRHAFDIVDDNERSREILRSTFAFLEEHLRNGE